MAPPWTLERAIDALINQVGSRPMWLRSLSTIILEGQKPLAKPTAAYWVRLGSQITDHMLDSRHGREGCRSIAFLFEPLSATGMNKVPKVLC